MDRKNEKLIIAGAGPAGVSAALYATRSGVTPLVLHKDGGALEKAKSIENYYGLPNPVSGKELYYNGISQIKALGVPVRKEELLAISYDGEYTVQTSEHAYHAKALILATGTKRNTLALKELKKYENSGISYCAVCDGFFYRGKEVAVLGNGIYALHEAKVLEPLAAKVTILTNGKEPSFSPDELGTIQVNTHVIRSAGGDPNLAWLELDDGSHFSLSGLFVALGTADSTDIARKLGLYIENNHIYIEADTSTALPGLYAAGDCTGGMLQIAKAVYEGALAGTEAVKYLKKISGIVTLSLTILVSCVILETTYEIGIVERGIEIMAMELTSKNFTEEVLNSNVPVMVDFWATWCMPCQMLAPVLEELSESANGAYKVGKVNVDAEPALAAQFGIMNIPTVLVFKNGQVAEKSVGVVPKAKLEALVK